MQAQQTFPQNHARPDGFTHGGSWLGSVGSGGGVLTPLCQPGQPGKGSWPKARPVTPPSSPLPGCTGGRPARSYPHSPVQMEPLSSSPSPRTGGRVPGSPQAGSCARVPQCTVTCTPTRADPPWPGDPQVLPPCPGPTLPPPSLRAVGGRRHSGCPSRTAPLLGVQEGQASLQLQR